MHSHPINRKTRRRGKDSSLSPADQRIAERVVALLARRASGEATARCRLVGPDQAAIDLPAAMVSVIEAAASILARGSEVSVLPSAGDLTTQEAAELLNVSRQYLVRLLDRGDVPAFKVGTHRRVRVEDLIAYRCRRDDARSEALGRLTALSQEIGGYDQR